MSQWPQEPQEPREPVAAEEPAAWTHPWPFSALASSLARADHAPAAFPPFPSCPEAWPAETQR